MIVSELDQFKQFAPFFQQKENVTSPGRQNESEIPGQISTTSNGETFADTLGEFISDVNSIQKESTNLTERMIKGEPVELHDVMIAAEKSKTTFQLLVELRNKFLDFYREIARTQV